MANRILSAKIELDNKNFNNSCKSIAKEMNLLDSTFKMIDSSIDKTEKKQEDLAKLQEVLSKKIDLLTKKNDLYKDKLKEQNKELAENTKAIDKTTDKIKEKEKEVQDLIKTEGENSDAVKKAQKELLSYNRELEKQNATNDRLQNSIIGLNTQINKTQTEINKTTNESKKLAQQFNNVDDSANDAADGLNNVSNSTNDIQNNINSIDFGAIKEGLSGLLDSFTQTLDALSDKVLEFTKYSIEAGRDFEYIMDIVAAKSGASKSEMEALTSEAKRLGGATKYSSTEVGESMVILSESGIKASDQITMLSTVLDSATAGNLTLDESAKILISTMNQFQMESSEVNDIFDILAVTSSSTSTSFDTIGQALIECGSIAKGLNIPLTDVSTLIGVLGNNSIESGRAGTVLKNVMIRLSAGTKPVEEALKKYNLEVKNSDGSMKSLIDIVIEFQNKLGHLNDTQRSATLTTIFGTEAVGGFTAMMSVSEEELRKLNSAIVDSNGAGSEMAKIMGDNLQGRIAGVKSQIEALALRAFEMLLPHIEKVVKALSEFLTKLSELSDEDFSKILKTGGFIVAGSAIMKVLSSIIVVLGNLGLLLVGLKGLGIASFGALSAAAAPILLVAGKVVLVIGAVGGALYGLFKIIDSGFPKATEKVDVFASGYVESSEKVSSANAAMSTNIQETYVEISEETKENLDEILKLEEDYSKKLLELETERASTSEGSLSDLNAKLKALKEKDVSTYTQLEKDKHTEEIRLLEEQIAKKVEKYNTDYETISKLRDDIHVKTLEKMKADQDAEFTLFLENKARTSGKTIEELKKEYGWIDESNKAKLSQYEKHSLELQELESKMADANYVMKEEDYARIKELQRLVRESAMTELTASEEEMQLIMANYDNNEKAMTEQHAIKMIQLAKTNADEKYKALSSMYSNQKLLIDTYYKDKGELGSTAHQNEIAELDNYAILEAESIKNNHEAAVTEVQSKHDKIEKIVNISTGEMLKWYERWGFKVKDEFSTVSSEIYDHKKAVGMIPDFEKKVLEIETRYTTVGSPSSNPINGKKSVKNIENKLINYKMTDISGQLKIKQSNDNILYQQSINFTNAINKLSNKIDEFNNNKEIIVNNDISISKKDFIDTIDTELMINNKKANKFKGAR